VSGNAARRPGCPERVLAAESRGAAGLGARGLFALAGAVQGQRRVADAPRGHGSTGRGIPRRTTDPGLYAARPGPVVAAAPALDWLVGAGSKPGDFRGRFLCVP